MKMKVYSAILFQVLLVYTSATEGDNKYITSENVSGGKLKEEVVDRELRRSMGKGNTGGMGKKRTRQLKGKRARQLKGKRARQLKGKRARQLFNENPRQKLPYIQDEVPQAPTLPSLYSINPSLSTHDWEKFSFDDFWEVLECANVPADSRPIHDISTWEYVRQAYEDIVGHERSSIQKAWSEIDAVDKKPSLAEESTFLYVDFVPGKGRGILASRDIKAGEHLWSDMYMAAFYHIKDINRFLAVLPTQLACDAMLWEFDHDKNSKDYFFTVNLDMSSFCNNGGSTESNVAWDYGPVVNDFFAKRDISIGEEILCNYGYEQVDE